jgi:hypothetical protein
VRHKRADKSSQNTNENEGVFRRSVLPQAKTQFLHSKQRVLSESKLVGRISEFDKKASKGEFRPTPNNKEVLNHVVKNPKHFEFQTTKIFKEVFNNDFDTLRVSIRKATQPKPQSKVFTNQHHFNR